MPRTTDGSDPLVTILQLCECYESAGDDSETSAAEMARIIRAVQTGGMAGVEATGPVARAVSGAFPPGHAVWRNVVLIP